MQAELESVKGEQLCMESSSLMERLESQQVREGKLRAEEAHVTFNTLNTGSSLFLALYGVLFEARGARKRRKNRS